MTLLKKAAIAFVILVLLLVFIVFTQGIRDSKSTVFYVTVPAETPELDTITLNIEGEVLPMQKISGNEYMLEVDTTGYEKGRPLRYGYVRGGFINIFGEGGEHITLGNVGSRNFVPGVKEREVRDTISEWKWLPAEPVVVDVQSRADTMQIGARPEFWAGPDLVDFWNPNFPLQYNSTIAHMKETGYKWVQLDPPWDYVSVDPPVIGNKDVRVPAWPGETLRDEIRAFKAAGFKVFLGPQVCCTQVNFANRSDEWWDQWYDQYEEFVEFHATLAREEGVDAFAITIASQALPGTNDAPSFAEERVDRIIEAAKKSGAPVGYGYHVLPPGDKPQPLWPQEAGIFYDDVDFLAISMWNSVSDKEFPTQSEIDAGFDIVFAEIDYNYNISKKPIVFAQVAYFSEKGAALPKGPEEFPSWEDPRKHRDSYDAKTQAMIYESLMRHAADRPFIQGIFPFGYYYADAPLNLDSDIRSKPAEQILANWLKRFPS